MNKINFLWGSFILLSLLILTQNFLIIYYASDQTQLLTAKASSGYVNMCINDAPYYPNPITCQEAFTGTPYSCNISAIDDSNASLLQYVVYVEQGPSINESLFNNITNGIMSFIANNTHIGNYTLRVEVVDDPSCPKYVNKTFNLTILLGNNSPYLISPIPDSEWEQDTILIPYNLNTYFRDPDGEKLSFRASGNTQIGITISSTGQVTLNPAIGFCGEEIITYIATDPTNLSATSNPVTLKVTCKEQNTATNSASGGGGGGGGGGSFGTGSGGGSCKENYFCYEWSECQWTSAVSTEDKHSLKIVGVKGEKIYLIDDPEYKGDPDLFYKGYKYRTCIDTSKCDTREKVYVRSCEYKPSCFDGIQNQNEEAIDCGGVCGPCGTCNDGIQNRDEEGVDCGGEYCEPCNSCFDGILNGKELGVDCGGPDCDACPTCFDGIQNHGEEGVDCGGPCKACSEIQEPAVISNKYDLWPLLIITVVLMTLVGILIVLRNAIKRLLTILALKHKKTNRVIILDEDAKTKILKELASIEKRIGKEPIIKLQEELSAAVRRYFKYAFGLDFEFTYDELLKALQEQKVLPLLREILSLYFKRSSELEFSGVNVTAETLKALIAEARELVYQTAVLTVDDIKQREKDLTLREIPSHVPPLVSLYLRLSNAHIALQYKRTLLAVTLYEQIQEIYARLSLSEQHKTYDDIYRLYLEIMFVEQQKKFKLFK